MLLANKNLCDNIQNIFAQDNWITELSNLMAVTDMSENDIVQHCVNSIENGKFLEIGANDGVDGHTRFLLEQGWHAVYCEPDPYACTRLIDNTQSYRDQVTIINSAISPKTGPIDFYLAINGDNMSSYDPAWLDINKKYHNLKDNTINDGTNRNPTNTRQIITNSLGFSELINFVGNDFDLIITDVEGMDAELIKSIDWQQFTNTKLIITEAGESVAKHLYTTGGFLPFARTKHNMVYYK